MKMTIKCPPENSRGADMTIFLIKKCFDVSLALLPLILWVSDCRLNAGIFFSARSVVPHPSLGQWLSEPDDGLRRLQRCAPLQKQRKCVVVPDPRCIGRWGLHRSNEQAQQQATSRAQATRKLFAEIVQSYRSDLSVCQEGVNKATADKPLQLRTRCA